MGSIFEDWATSATPLGRIGQPRDIAGVATFLTTDDPDKLEPGERCASTSNRNFEGRQGYRGRTHLVSPAMAAVAAVIAGRFVDVRDWR